MKKETFKKIKIWQDISAINPFKEFDGQPGLMNSSNGPTITDYSEGSIIDFVREQATDGKVIYHQKAIAEILEIDLEGKLTFLNDNGLQKYEFTKED